MGLLDFFKSWWNRRTVKPLDDGTVERAFNVTPATSEVMKKGIALWWALYTNNPPWETLFEFIVIQYKSVKMNTRYSIPGKEDDTEGTA